MINVQMINPPEKKTAVENARAKTKDSCAPTMTFIALNLAHPPVLRVSPTPYGHFVTAIP